MELYEAVLKLVAGFMGLATFTFTVVKFADPIKKFFSRIKKTDTIEVNYVENQSQNKQIETLQGDITLIEGRLEGVEQKMGNVEEKIDTISAGVKHLLGTSLGYVNDPEAAKIAYRKFK